MAGATTFILRLGGSGAESGPGNILSDARRLRIGLKYPSSEYAGEELAFDGSRVSVGLNRPGDRSELAQFVYHHEVMMQEGLLGGVLSAAWGLLDTGDRKPKHTYAGLTKMEGKPLHEIHYRPRRGASDLQRSNSLLSWAMNAPGQLSKQALRRNDLNPASVSLSIVIHHSKLPQIFIRG